MVQPRLDVLVVGGGPAGCAVAIRAREAGLSVVLVEASKSPRLSPGETLHPGIEPVLYQLGVREEVLKENFMRHHAVWVTKDGVRKLIPYGQDEYGLWRGFQVDRQRLQQILQEAMLSRGVTVFSGVNAEAVLLEKNVVTGVWTNGEPIRARWTVDATGRAALLAGQLGLEATVNSPRLGASFGWGSGAREDLMGQPAFEFRCDGWDWIATIGQNRTAWVKLRIARPHGQTPLGVDQTWRMFPGVRWARLFSSRRRGGAP